MKLKNVALGLALVSLNTAIIADEPTRGFIIEHGSTAPMGKASIDVSPDTGDDNFGLGARFGLGNSELLLSRANVGNNLDATGAVFKYSIPNVEGLAAYAGMVFFDDDNDGYFNFKIGAAFSVTSNRLQLTVNPEVVIDGKTDDTYLLLGLGAFYDFDKTPYGKFKPGVEIVASSADGVDPLFLLGVRWEYNSRVTVDAVPVLLGNNDILTLPGQIRINLMF